jgi:hypothetical protein
MAFDRVQAPPEAGETPPPEVPYSREFGRTYVAPAEVERYLILDDHEVGTLAAWATCLVPGGGEWPSAADVDAPMYVDNCAARSPLLRSMLLRGLAAVRAQAWKEHRLEFAECSASDQHAILRKLESGRDSALFELILELTYEGYYRAEPVLGVVARRTGFRVRGPLDGTELEPFDERLLARVRGLSRRYREVRR